MVKGYTTGAPKCHPKEKYHALSLCKACYYRHYNKNDDKHWERKLKFRYGLSRDDYMAMLEKQKGLCAICLRPPKKIRLSVDHNHKTGVNRGLLCMICNRWIVGVMEKYGVKPEKVAEYLNAY